MDKGNFLGSGWAFPVSTNSSGNISMTALEHSVQESIHLILSTTKGERVMRPDFGCEINDLIFSPNTPHTCNLISHYIEEALIKWEPRIILKKVEATIDLEDQTKINISVNYTIRAINSAFNMVYPFYLERGESDTKSQLR